MIGSLVLLAGLLAEGAGLALELQARLPPTGGAELLTIIFSNATLDLARCEVCVNTSVGGVLRDGKCFSGSDVAHATVRITGAPGKYRASGDVRCGVEPTCSPLLEEDRHTNRCRSGHCSTAGSEAARLSN